VTNQTIEKLNHHISAGFTTEADVTKASSVIFRSVLDAARRDFLLGRDRATSGAAGDV
jgi:hypothetical protein